MKKQYPFTQQLFLEAVLNLFSTNFIKYNLGSGRMVTIQRFVIGE